MNSNKLILTSTLILACASYALCDGPTPSANERAQEKSEMKWRKEHAKEIRYDESQFLAPASDVGTPYRYDVNGNPVTEPKPKHSKKKSRSKSKGKSSRTASKKAAPAEAPAKPEDSSNQAAARSAPPAQTPPQEQQAPPQQAQQAPKPAESDSEGSGDTQSAPPAGQDSGTNVTP